MIYATQYPPGFTNNALKFLSFLVNTNIYISLGAVLLTLETQVQLGMKPQLYPYLFIIFFATIFEYNLHRLITILFYKDALKDEKHRWVNRNLILFFILVGLCIIGFSIAIFYAKREVLITLAPIALITLFYSLPVFKRNTRLFRLREISGLKIFLIAVVWSAVTILLPIIESGKNFNNGHIFLIFIERFLFIFAITIPFDIRDMESDSKAGLKTIPLIIGETKAIYVSNILLALFLILSIVHYSALNLYFILIAIFLSGIISIVFINSKRLKKFNYYHYIILDGTLLIQGILVCLSYYFYAAITTVPPLLVFD